MIPLSVLLQLGIAGVMEKNVSANLGSSFKMAIRANKGYLAMNVVTIETVQRQSTIVSAGMELASVRDPTMQGLIESAGSVSKLGQNLRS